MKKNIILTLVACLVLLACMMGAVACDTPENTEETSASETSEEMTTKPETEETTAEAESNTYTLTVKDKDGNPVEGVVAQMCVGDTCFMPRATDGNGKIVFKNIDNPSSEPLKIQILAADSVEGYTYPSEKIEVGADQNEIELTVEKNG